MKTATSAKLMSISSDIKKSILPSVHNRINSIYRKRLAKYLNLVSIHGDRNQQLINSIFNGRRIEEEELRRLQQEIAVIKLRQIQNQDIDGVMHTTADRAPAAKGFELQNNETTTMMGFKDSQHSVTYQSVTPVEATSKVNLNQPPVSPTIG